MQPFAYPVSGHANGNFTIRCQKSWKGIMRKRIRSHASARNLPIFAGIVQTALDRSRKKYDLLGKQLKDTEKRDKFRIYGELLNTYGYEAVPGSRELSAVNYYTG